ncbi:hypothetical protein CEUSTIGMA_g5476.t1 [Chlamydomonas eustigma]|uniref:COI1 F-box domain-containing protein n=1 Tax=Chlamydomonas eustigma TaxID=1157962 RepID=A0A250X4M3_9CHLO|nr:hypothetical protein CEUSTIGMA_g5476.t1 [Chlamydomonas eustigma]|eukprot:GAX78034.1 hypothetical protein CEUSTIGMA_g5476.t1 [Chlamydomonas eustigma]
MDSKKRNRHEQKPVPTGEEPLQQVPSASKADDEQDRRADMAKLARRRAAHFAHFKGDDDADNAADNVHTGSNEARTLGPWSSAVELVNARQKAQAAREDKLQGRAVAAVNGEEDPAQPVPKIQWSPTRDVSQGPRPGPSAIPALFTLCLTVLNEYVDCIDSLVGVPDTIRIKLAAFVCSKRRMSKEVAQLFAQGAPAEVVLPDCHHLDAVSMTDLVQECVTYRLERLELGSCGRGFGDSQAQHLTKLGTLHAMSQLSLGGAYRLSDQGLEQALTVLSALSSLKLAQCSRLTGSVIERLPSLLPILRHLDLHDCRGIAPEALISALPGLSQLQDLRLDGMHQVEDDVMSAIARMYSLRALGISYTQVCHKLYMIPVTLFGVSDQKFDFTLFPTMDRHQIIPIPYVRTSYLFLHNDKVSDVGLSSVAAGCPGLQALYMDECLKITDAGLLALSSGCKYLTVLSARRCTKLSDEALASVVQRGTLQRLLVSGVHGCGVRTMQALALNCKECLEHLDVSFCRGVTEQALGLVADSCRLLSNLVVFGCSHVGNTFLHGHSNDRLSEVIGIGTILAN